MNISGFNAPVEFYNKNTGNNIGYTDNNAKNFGATNIFASEKGFELNRSSANSKVKKKKKNNRLNTIDTDYIPDEINNEDTTEQTSRENIFIGKEQKENKLKKTVTHIIETVPLINYFSLRKKEEGIKDTLKTLSDINQNIDEIMNTKAPYGEEKDYYENMARSLTDAAILIGKTNKKYGTGG